MRRLRCLIPGNQPTLLDYGSGFSRWARAAVTAGFDVWAYEPAVVRGYEETPPFRLISDRCDLKGRTFDAIDI